VAHSLLDIQHVCNKELLLDEGRSDFFKKIVGIAPFTSLRRFFCPAYFAASAMFCEMLAA